MNHFDPVIGGIRGFRWWRLTSDGWLLSPWRGKYRWDPTTNRAQCLFRKRLTGWQGSRIVHPHGPPAAECDCGFYALYRVPQVRDQAVGYSWEIPAESSGQRQGLLFGVAEASGRTLLASGGWRAEFARPRAVLWGSRTTGEPRLVAAAARYDLAVYRDLDLLVQEWGPDESERRALLSV